MYFLCSLFPIVSSFFRVKNLFPSRIIYIFFQIIPIFSPAFPNTKYFVYISPPPRVLNVNKIFLFICRTLRREAKISIGPDFHKSIKRKYRPENKSKKMSLKLSLNRINANFKSECNLQNKSLIKSHMLKIKPRQI